MFNLPFEIIREILSHIDDNIDLRRKYHVYGKINLKSFDFLNKVLVILDPKYISEKNFRFKFIENKELIVNRKAKNIDDDLIEMHYIQSKNFFYRELHIFRLIKNPNGKYTNKKDIYYKADLDDRYYWNYICFSVKIE